MTDRGSDTSRRMLKRAFDLVVGGLALLALSPLMAVVALMIRRKLGSPVLFRQVRPGLNGAPFTMFKFRTMLDATTADGTPLPDAERLVPFGRWLRATSLDELPELWNVMRGEMSLVGPRPLAMAYLPLFSAEQMRRHEALPGITGWAQVNGRNAIGWSQKFDYDVWYVDHSSILLDLRILFMTVMVVLRRSNVSAGGQDEVESFDGTN